MSIVKLRAPVTLDQLVQGSNAGHYLPALTDIDLMSPGPAQSPTDPGLLDLSIIGVPEPAQNRRPTFTSFPRKFNQNAIGIWKAMIDDPAYQMEMKLLARMEAIWHNTVVEFMQRCADANVDPFNDNSAIVNNQYVYDYLNRGRIFVVNYFNEIGIFPRVRVKKAFREFRRKENGLIVNTWCQTFPLKESMEDFERWLVQAPLPRLHKTQGNRFERMIQPHIMVWVRALNYAKVYVGFSIQVVGSISIPDQPTPTRKQLDQFIDQHIWLPIIRSHRFPAVKNRLF